MNQRAAGPVCLGVQGRSARGRDAEKTLDLLQEVLGGLWSSRRRLARDRGGGEVALRIALAAQVEVIAPCPKEGTPVKVPLDPSHRTLQHITHLAGLEMS